MQAMMPPRHADPVLPGLRAVRLSATHHRSEPAFGGTPAERYRAVSGGSVGAPSPRENGTLRAAAQSWPRLGRTRSQPRGGHQAEICRSPRAADWWAS
jgi:hypothetical protein